MRNTSGRTHTRARTHHTSYSRVACHVTARRCLPDVVTIEKTGENFRLMLDTKGRFVVHAIDTEEAKVTPLSSCPPRLDFGNSFRQHSVPRRLG